MTKRYFRGKPIPPKKPFMGETMTCKQCGKSEKSNPHTQSQWTAVDLDNERYYFCPTCFGNAVRESQSEGNQ